MSVARRDYEQVLRTLELDEEKRAAKIRAELCAVPSVKLRPHHVQHRTHHLLVLGKDGRSLAAKFLLEWWEKRCASGRHRRRVSTNEIQRIAGIIRRLE